MEETLKAVTPKSKLSGGVTMHGNASAGVVRLSHVSATTQSFVRFGTGMHEFDRVLGGGIVPGSVVLIGGEPGIGKSTLLTHLVINLAQATELNKQISSSPILYVAGEESPEQIILRIERMVGDGHIGAAWKDHIAFVSSGDVDTIIATIEQERPSLVIIDSIQTLRTEDLTGSAGSIGQLKECTERLTRVAKGMHIPTFLVGHVTKDGAIAGPKVLEHVVDTVLELTGERTGSFRLLRAIKNRFGATDEVGVFQVVEEGLAEVSNPSALFLEERQAGAAGSALACVIEGTRPMIIEIQSLVVPTQLAMPRRVARGIALPRLQVIAAVLQKHCRLPLGSADIFVNVTGGLSVNEPAVDLAVAAAIASSQKNKPLAAETVCIGEVGLLGEIRRVSLLDKRIKECTRLGFSNICSSQDAKTLPALFSKLF